MRSQIINKSASQRGATLIVVLIILLVITVVGVLAIRVAIVSLAVATNSQVDQLNFQSADTPLYLLSNNNPTTLTQFSHVVGAALRTHEDTPGGEYIFCYKPTSSTVRFGQAIDAAFIRATSATEVAKEGGVGTGLCNLQSDFGSSRQAVLTQVAVSVPVDATDDEPGAHLPRGINVSEGTQLPKQMTSTQRVRVTATSMLPAYSSTPINTIQTDCLSTSNLKISDNASSALSGSQTLADCLASKDVPFNVQVQEFNYLNKLTQVTAPGS